ncbi:YggU family protein [Candidatus Woesearchaeota archaeon]|nr:YggU family protein [Candidatus Woesearchaeota archaeon]
MDLPRRISVHVKPNAVKTELLEAEGTCMKIALKAPPQDGKANLELIKFFSKQFKKRIRIVSGITSKHKVIEVVE